jgi:hypothetical protein
LHRDGGKDKDCHRPIVYRDPTRDDDHRIKHGDITPIDDLRLDSLVLLEPLVHYYHTLSSPLLQTTSLLNIMHSSSLPVSMTVQSSAVRVLLFAVLALTVSLRTAKAQNPTRSPTRAPSTPEPTVVGWGGCVDPDGSNKKVTIGEKTTVCLQLGNGNNWAAGTEYIRLAFQPKADEYTRFFVPQCTYCIYRIITAVQLSRFETSRLGIRLKADTHSFRRKDSHPLFIILYSFSKSLLGIGG